MATSEHPTKRAKAVPSNELVQTISLGSGSGVVYANRPEVNVGYVEPTLFSFAHDIFQEEGRHQATIYLGPKTAASKRAYNALRQAGVVGIVNCTRRVPCYHHSSSSYSGGDDRDDDNKKTGNKKNIRYCQVPVHDEAGAKIITYLDGATTFMRRMLLQEEVSVLVHCEQGMSRSATVVMAYLMRFHNMTRDEAYVVCKTKRPMVNPNEGFWDQLKDYETRIAKRRHHATISTTVIDPLDETWQLQASAMFTTCREIPDVLATEPQWQSLSTIQSENQLQQFLFHCLDFVWGRGVMDIDIEFLLCVCQYLPTMRLSPHQALQHMLEDPESEFSQTWSGEVYPKDVQRIMDATA